MNWWLEEGRAYASAMEEPFDSENSAHVHDLLEAYAEALDALEGFGGKMARDSAAEDLVSGAKAYKKGEIE